MQAEYGMRLEEVLDQKRWRTDLAGRILNSWLLFWFIGGLLRGFWRDRW
jgi:hypothetical protein